MEKLIKRKELEISPFSFSNLTPAGYDLRAYKSVKLKPMEYALIATLEKVKLSLKIVGFLYIKSSLAREGVFASLAVVDPGFDGQLTISLFNSTNKSIQISKEEPFVQIVFFKLIEKAKKGYKGKYQHSKGVVESKRTNKGYKINEGK
ncbi:MAG: dCTP deaminase [Candidatus Bathyarchaeia archaeon]